MKIIKKITSYFVDKTPLLADVLVLQDKEKSNFNNLKTTLTRTKIAIIDVREDCFFATFIERKTEYELCFDLRGNLMYIESEYWKDFDEKYVAGKKNKLD